MFKRSEKLKVECQSVRDCYVFHFNFYIDWCTIVLLSKLALFTIWYNHCIFRVFFTLCLTCHFVWFIIRGFSYFSVGALLQHLLWHGRNIIDHNGDKLWYVPRYPLSHNGYNTGAAVLDTRELVWYIQSFIIFLVSFVMSVLNCWSLSWELSVYLFGFYLWITVCPVPMLVFRYFSHLTCMYTYLILIMWCNIMWAFFVLHLADVCSCFHMYGLYIHTAFLLVPCMWLPFSVTSHPLPFFMSLLLLLLLLSSSSSCFILLSIFFPISLSLFYFGRGAGKCFVLCCDVYHY